MILIAAALTLVQPAAPRQDVSPAIAFVCQEDLPEMGLRGRAWVNLLVDAAYRPVRTELFIRTDDFDAVWQLGRGLANRAAMREFSYLGEVPRGVRFPLSVRMTGDGQSLWSGSMEGPSRRIEIRGESEQIRNIHGLSHLTVTFRDGRGRVVVHDRVSLPNWRWIEQEARGALRRAERVRRSGSCMPDVVT
jgi:hypothetical protein